MNWSLGAVERWARDPGWLRLTQGLKTILAILVFLALVNPFGSDALVRGAVATGFLMQCGEGATRRQRQVTMAVTGLLLIVLACMGALLHGHPWIKGILLVGAAFLTFYLRRFVIGKPGFTAYAFVIFLLACMFPGGEQVALSYAAVLSVTLVVSFVVFFAIRPPDLLAACTGAVRARCAGIGLLLGQPFTGDPSSAKRIRQVIVRLGALIQALLDAAPPGPGHQKAEEVLADQIDVWQMVEMILDSLARVKEADRPAEVDSLLSALFQALANALLAVAEGQPEGPEGEAALAALQRWCLASSTPLGPTLTHVGGVLLVAQRLLPAVRRLGRHLEAIAREECV